MSSLEKPGERPDPLLFVSSTLSYVIFCALFVFLPAGNWAWERGWIFVVSFWVLSAIAAIYLWRVNPEIYVARSRFHKGTKRWDAILLVFLFAAMFAIVVVAALDDGRFHWLPQSWWVVAIGYSLVLCSFGLMTWAEAVNKFFEPSVRIQTDRGHRVIDTGPYATIRHPGYVGGILLCAGVALALGSLWALAPAAIAAGLLILRTIWEDRTLRSELPGYQEFAERVRYKMIPSLW